MATTDRVITDRYAVYNSDCIPIMQSMPAKSIHLSIYSPPFGGLYQYSSSERDLSNCDSYEQFFEQYAFVVEEIHRLTIPGRLTAVHAMDCPRSNSGNDTLIDFPGDIIRLHEKCGFGMACRHFIWKEPLSVRNRTMQHNLSHQTIVNDGTLGGVASADQLIIFRKGGDNPIPVTHSEGLTEYFGEREIPADLQKYKRYKGLQRENRFSHWIWRQYASSFWDDIRKDRILPFRESRDSEDEKHVHPLQLDVIDRCVQMRSNPDETILTPFMGVGSEVYSAVRLGRRGIGCELKSSYFRQAVKNMALIGTDYAAKNEELPFDDENIPETA